MKKFYLAICACILLSCIAPASYLYAEDAQGPDASGKKNFIKFGPSIGGIIYGVLGPRDISLSFYKIKFDLDKFKIGFSGGVDGLFFPTKYHSVSLGAFYEQRNIDLKIIDFKILMPLAFFAFTPIPFLPVNPAALLYVFPIEQFISTTSLTSQYINLPVIYRFHPIEYLYLGLGFDFAFLLKAVAEYKIFIFKAGLDLKRYFKLADIAGKVLIGVAYKGAFIEVSTGIGLLDMDSFAGVRRSFCIKTMAGYRF